MKRVRIMEPIIRDVDCELDVATTVLCNVQRMNNGMFVLHSDEVGEHTATDDCWCSPLVIYPGEWEE